MPPNTSHLEKGRTDASVFSGDYPEKNKAADFYWLADIAAHEQRAQQKTEPQK
jgi:hypothetical protein